MELKYEARRTGWVYIVINLHKPLPNNEADEVTTLSSILRHKCKQGESIAICASAVDRFNVIDCCDHGGVVC